MQTALQPCPALDVFGLTMLNYKAGLLCPLTTTRTRVLHENKGTRHASSSKQLSHELVTLRQSFTHNYLQHAQVQPSFDNI